MFKSLFSAGAIALLTAVAAPAYATTTTTIDFSDYANTYLSSANGVTFSLAPGYAVNGFGTTPYVNAFGDPAIANSANYGEYPTSNTLTFTFSSSANNLSFYFDNYGGSDSGRGATFYDAYGSNGNLISSGSIGLCCEVSYTDVIVAGSGIKSLVLNNNTGDPTGNSNSWLFGVSSVTYSAVPEASTWVMMLAGFAGLGFVGYRRNKVVNFAA